MSHVSIRQTHHEHFQRGKQMPLGGSNSMREFLEKSYKETSGQETVKLAIRALLEVVESGGKNIEAAVMTKEHGLRQLEEAEIDAIVAEKAAAEAAKKAPSQRDLVLLQLWMDKHILNY